MNKLGNVEWFLSRHNHKMRKTKKQRYSKCDDKQTKQHQTVPR